MTGKPMLATHYATIGSPPSTTAFVGWFEIALGVAVLVRPAVGLLLFVAAWKLATESLFVVAGAPIWEFVERAGSYAAPIALAVLLNRRTAQSPLGPFEVRAVWKSAPFGSQRRLEVSAVWKSAPFGSQRRSEVSAVRKSAPFGSQRRSEVSAVRKSAPFGSQRRSEVSAVRKSAPFGSQRRSEVSAVRKSAPLRPVRPLRAAT